jgi:hypothetical protein
MVFIFPWKCDREWKIRVELNEKFIEKIYYYSTFLLDSKWDYFCQADILVLRHDVDCGYNFNDKAYSPIIDSIVEDCFRAGFSVFSFATPFSVLVEEKAYNSPAVLNRSFFLVALIGRLLRLTIGKNKSAKWKASQKTKLWNRVLERVKPKLIIGIQPDLSLCRASKKLNVPVYDFQHGVIASDHWWYGIKLRHEIDEMELPSGFLCWDDNSKEALEQWAPSKGASVSVVGHPWFERFQVADEKDHLVQTVLKQSQIFDNDLPTILVSLQWGLHIHYYKDNEFNKIMCQALETTIKETSHRYNWLLRLHPVQLRGQEAQFCENYLNQNFGDLINVEWRKTSLLPLPVVIKQSDLHITDMSTVVIEAAWLGVPSALLNPYLADGERLQSLFQNERCSGMASLVPSEVKAIELWIENTYEGKRNFEIQNSSKNKFRCWLLEKMK